MRKYIYLLIALIMTSMMLQAQERTIKINGDKINLQKDIKHSFSLTGENNESIKYKAGNLMKATYAIPVELRNTTGETTKYTLNLIDPGSQKTAIVLVIRKHLGLGLAASKEFVDNAPSVLGEDFDFEDVRAFYRELISKGATAEYVSDNAKEVIFFDPRDGYDYRVINVDGIAWLADNLMYLPAISASSDLSETDPLYYVYSYNGDDVAEAKESDKYNTYGVLYNREAALTACPEGWELPGDVDYANLQNFLGNEVNAYPKLRDYDDIYWASMCETATNEIGFNALPGGFLEAKNNSFQALGYNARWWTSTFGMTTGKGDPFYVGFMLSDEDEKTYFFNSTRSDEAYSVRCIQSKPNITVKYFIDQRDGREYEYAKLGADEWMLENLAYMPSTIHHEDDISSDEPRFYVYNEDHNVADEARGSYYYMKYGTLYNRRATEVACPVGWHVPTDEEWNTLFDYIGGRKGTAYKLKSTEGWAEDGNGQDLYKFNALPGGTNDFGEFVGETRVGYWWADTDDSYATLYYLAATNNDIIDYADDPSLVGSLRCVKDKGDDLTYRVVATDLSAVNETAFVNALMNIAGVDQRDAMDTYAKHPPVMAAKGLDFETARALYRALIGINAGVYYETNSPDVSVMFDDRDGRDYKTTTIADQTWMAENLAYLTSVYRSSQYSTSSQNPRTYVLDYEGNDVVEAKQTENYQNLGVLYNWYAAQTACPDGWRIPDDDDWDELRMNVGGGNAVGKVLKATYSWIDSYRGEDANGTDEFDFSALASGIFAGALKFMNQNESTAFWSATNKNQHNQVIHRLNAQNDDFANTYGNLFNGYSIRCIKE